MGKNIVSVILVLLCLSTNAQTDKAAYGFQGKVKKITYYIYNDCQLDSTQIWQEDLCPMSAMRIMYFDKEGNMYKSIDELYGNGTQEKFLTEYNHVFNRIKSSKRYRLGTKAVLEEMKFFWSMDNRHCAFKSVGLTTFSEGTRLLNWRNREVGGSYSTRTKKGKQLLNESYTNEIDSFGTLVKTNYSNAESGNYTIVYSYHIKDEYKNAMEVVLRFADTKKVQRYIRKEFEYYEEK